MISLIQNYVKTVNSFASNIEIDGILSATQQLVSFIIICNYKGKEEKTLYQSYPNVEERFKRIAGPVLHRQENYVFSSFVFDIISTFLSLKGYSMNFSSIRTSQFPYTLFRYSYLLDNNTTFLHILKLIEYVLTEIESKNVRFINCELVHPTIKEILKDLDIRKFVN